MADKKLYSFPTVVLTDSMNYPAGISNTANYAVPHGTLKDYVNAGKAGGKTIEGGTLTTQTLSMRNNAVDDLGVDILGDGRLRVNTANYEALLGDDDDIPNLKYVNDQIGGVNEFSELTDVAGAYTTQNAIYRVNDTVDGLEETTVKIDEPAANQFSLEAGTTLLEVTAASKIDQDLQQSASPTFADVTATNEVVTDKLMERTLNNGIEIGVSGNFGKFYDYPTPHNSWFVFSGSGLPDDGTNIYLPYDSSDGTWLGFGMGATDQIHFGTNGTEFVMTGNGQFKCESLKFAGATTIDQFVTGTANNDKGVTQGYVDDATEKPQNTFTISPSGGDYTTIQAALDANTSGGELFIVYPGTYTNDTITFTANNQCVRGAGALEQQLVSSNAQIVNWGAFTGCCIEKMKLALTATSNITLGTGTGDFKFNSSWIESNLSGTFTGSQLILNAGGNVTLLSSTLVGNNSVVASTGDKSAISIAAGANVNVLRSTVNIANSNSSQFTTLFSGSGTGTFDLEYSDVSVVDNDSTITAGVANLTGSGSNLSLHNNITVTNNTNTAYAYQMTSGTAIDLRGVYNKIEVNSSGGTAVVYASAAPVVTYISHFEDLLAPSASTGPGTYTYVNADTDGDVEVSGSLTSETVNYDYRVGGTSSVLSLVAASGITAVNYENIPIQSSTAGAITITANPAIAAGVEGKRLTLLGRDDTKTVTWTNGNGLDLENDQPFTMGENDVLEFIFSNGVWIETNRHDN